MTLKQIERYFLVVHNEKGKITLKNSAHVAGGNANNSVKMCKSSAGNLKEIQRPCIFDY